MNIENLEQGGLRMEEATRVFEFFKQRGSVRCCCGEPHLVVLSSSEGFIVSALVRCSRCYKELAEFVEMGDVNWAKRSTGAIAHRALFAWPSTRCDLCKLIRCQRLTISCVGNGAVSGVKVMYGDKKCVPDGSEESWILHPFLLAKNV